MGAEWLSHHCLHWRVAAPSAGTSGPGHLGQQLLPSATLLYSNLEVLSCLKGATQLMKLFSCDLSPFEMANMEWTMTNDEILSVIDIDSVEVRSPARNVL